MPFSSFIYNSWKKIQHQKYKEVWPKIKDYLDENSSMLDFGIGKAWFEHFLEHENFNFRKIVGFDVDEKMTEPRKSNIEYIISEKLETGEKFDFVTSFDSAHLIQDVNELKKYVKTDGYLLISVPERFKEVIDKLDAEKLVQGTLGEIEVDYFVFCRC